MDETVPVSIGGQIYRLPLIVNFATLKRIAEPLDAYTGTTKPIWRVAACIRIVEVMLRATNPELTSDEIENRLRVNVRDGLDERAPLEAAVAQLVQASGLIPKGEAEAPAATAEMVALAPVA